MSLRNAMRALHPGLVARLAIVGVTTALLPFAVAVALLRLAPHEIAMRPAARELDLAVSVAGAQIHARSTQLRLLAVALDQHVLRRAVESGRRAAPQAYVDEVWGATVPDASSRSLSVQVADEAPVRKTEHVVAERITITMPSGMRHLLITEPAAFEQVAAPVERQLNVSLRVVRDEPARSAASNLVSSSREIGPARERWLVAQVEGTRLQLLAHGRGDDLGLALVLLLVSAIASTVAVALLLSRMLGRVAVVAEQIAGGRYDHRLPIVGRDAAARLASSLNSLAAEVQRRIRSLERSVDRLDRSLDAIDDGVCAWSFDGHVETWNPAAQRLTGYGIDDAQNVASHIHAALREQLSIGSRRVMLPVAGGGQHVAVDLTVRPMRDGGVLQAFRDAGRAVSLEQARANFLVTAAHQLRTPLTSVLGFAATLADDQLELTDATRRLALRQLVEDAGRLDDVVTALFDASLLARDRIEVDLGIIDVLHAVTEALRARPPDHARAVRVHIAPGLHVRADAAALLRVLDAVLDNAEKYGEPPISIAASVVDERVEIRVQDSGSGIAPDLVDAVFEPFMRADPDMLHDVAGTGMGLFVARAWMEAMGGSCGLQLPDDSSGATTGTCIVLTLPVAAPNDS